MVRVLITGASGFLGKIIKFNLNDCVVYELNRNSGDYHCSLENEVPDFKERFDLVIHSAGKAHSLPKTEGEKQSFFDVNVKGTQNLLKGLVNSGLPKQFVFISSVSVYGMESGILISEKAPLLAKDPYGLSKIEAEIIVQEWCNRNNVICTILRLPLLVGKNAPGNLGAMCKSIQKGLYFNVAGGTAKKSMVLASDVGKFIPVVATIGGVYNLTDGLHPNFNDLSRTVTHVYKKSKPKNMPLIIAKLLGFIGDLMGAKAPINTLKLKKITSDLTFDDAKARNNLNWNPQSVLDYINKNSI